MDKENWQTILLLLLHAFVLIGAVIAEYFLHLGLLTVAVGIIIIVAVLTTVLLNFRRTVAYFKQTFQARLSGYWEGKSLNKQIVKNFNAAEEIKIKVTRGSIFLDEDNGFYKCIMKKNDKTATTNEIKILLHYPCQHSYHLETRAKAHKQAEQEYLGKLYNIIQKLLEAKKDYKLNLIIKLYGDQQIKWRYYIFRDSKNRKSLFLGYYDDDKKGNLTPMLKVRGSKKDDNTTLCDDFDVAFNYIFEHKSFNLKEIFEADLSVRKNCLECLKADETCLECHNIFKHKIENIIETFSIPAQ